MLGCDISKYQSDIDLSKAKKYGYSFVMIRSGDGKTKDPCAEKFIRSAVENTLPFGVYHFSRAKTKSEAIAEADLVCDLVAGKPCEMPITLDMEVYKNREQNTIIFEEFCRRVRERFGNKAQCMLYTGLSFFNNYFYKDRVAKTAHLWIARYNTIPPYVGYPIFMWQYTSATTTGFYNKKLDKDILMQPYRVFNTK